MRIDTNLLPQAFGFMTSPSPSGGGLSFETLSSSSQDVDRAPLAKPAASQRIFSFDALGVLGLGGTVASGRPAKTATEDDRSQAPAAHAAPSEVGQGQPVPSAPVGGTEVFASHAASSPASGGRDVVDSPAAPQLAPPAQPSAVQARALPASAPSQGGGTTSSPAFAGPLPVEAGASLTPVAQASRPVYPQGRASAADGPEDSMETRKAPPATAFEAEAEPSSSQVSVTLSEGDGVVNVAAAASDLAEADHQALRRVADEAAGAAGIAVGELRLNGVPIRPFSKVR